MHEFFLIPECSCGAGPMTVNCARSKAQHPLRYYYKCPSDKNHRRSFLWCDEYHSNHRPEHVSKFLASQMWSPSSGATSSKNDSNSSPVDLNKLEDRQKLTTIPHEQSKDLAIVFNEFRVSCYFLFRLFTCFAFVFMCFVLVLLGVILGKIM